MIDPKSDSKFVCPSVCLSYFCLVWKMKTDCDYSHSYPAHLFILILMEYIREIKKYRTLLTDKYRSTPRDGTWMDLRHRQLPLRWLIQRMILSLSVRLSVRLIFCFQNACRYFCQIGVFFHDHFPYILVSKSFCE